MLKDDLYECYQEYCNIDKPSSVQYIGSLNEAEQRSELSTLVTRLYKMITNKITSIDYKLIAKSQGDVTKFVHFDQTKECIDVLLNLAKEANDGSEKEVEVINKALLNLVDKRDLFIKGFRLNIGLIEITYNNILMAIIADIGFMTSVCVEFIKNPNSTVTMEINNLKEYRTRFDMIHGNLARFNEICDNGDLDKSFEPMISLKAKKFVGELTTAALVMFCTVLGVSVVITILKSIVPICRELAFIFYDARLKISTYFELQKKLLEANALRVRSDKSIEDAQKVADRQLAIAKFFERVANKFMFDYVPAQKRVEKELDKEKETAIDQWKQEVDDQAAQTSIF